MTGPSSAEPGRREAFVEELGALGPELGFPRARMRMMSRPSLVRTWPWRFVRPRTCALATQIVLPG
jgi:hypothetical protein